MRTIDLASVGVQVAWDDVAAELARRLDSYLSP